MIEAWEWSITHQNDDPENPIRVISISFGGGGYSGNCDSASPTMTQAAANAVAAGITIFASSGNDGYCSKIAWPACISHVVSVGAVFDAAIGNVGFCIDSTSCASTELLWLVLS
jgi:subtilisin family serine protease